MKTLNELRNLSIKELSEELLQLRKEQFNLRMKRASGSLEKTHLVGLVRKTIARVKTVMTEKVGKSHVE
ncbi:50S ribosomal protein L29 [Legionella quinlivanii]|uniref:Large ribosomal subunit protein uL29 n=1 Tax=Legionella quinlivanii TaxID=45073 RepID=A0A0W0XXW3_9GAMM|nr:50S ribosomal protein L29 [Legionella quinlivanii]KTD49623.1 50S ribosomal protein L29 [Legionella quinlivanii]MCW8452013.1 50S ribosomal protein L29 [Legionella quinlivanii]SEG31529.1 LSU ribosomal protein L29P [Legionella quinlivanii DSM 21216]STY09790.1 50S ribosomal protein L29 [Legionella quinlivanii]